MANKVPGGRVDRTRLAVLREKVVTATDLSDVVRYFFDELADKPGFLELGERFTDATLSEVLGQVVIRIVPGGARRIELVLLRLPEDRFVHGTLAMPRWHGTFLYFEDIRRGVLALGGMAGPMHFARFTVVEPPSGHRSSLH